MKYFVVIVDYEDRSEDDDAGASLIGPFKTENDAEQWLASYRDETDVMSAYSIVTPTYPRDIDL